MSDLISTPESADQEPLLDTLLREAAPEIKLALGDLIDRENQRAIPDRYQKMLPESTLVVTLRPDAGQAVQPIAAELERELTDSCMRHGLLYDREYRVRLRQAAHQGAPLFRVSVGKEGEPEPPPISAAPPAPAAAPAAPVQPVAPAQPAAPAAEATMAVPPPAAPRVEPRPPEIRVGPSMDPDATRLDGMPAAPSAPADVGGPAASRFDAERFELAVEDEDGTERERFPITAPMATVGRQTDKAELRSDIQLTGASHVSRRQLALVWSPRGEEDGFTVYNLGLNSVHVGETEVPGANAKGALALDELMEKHTARLLPGDAVRIGQHGPVLRIRDTGGGDEEGEEGEDAPPADEVPEDPDATRFG